jgi:hypothetical protein
MTNLLTLVPATVLALLLAAFLLLLPIAIELPCGDEIPRHWPNAQYAAAGPDARGAGIISNLSSVSGSWTFISMQRWLNVPTLHLRCGLVDGRSRPIPSGSATTSNPGDIAKLTWTSLSQVAGHLQYRRYHAGCQTCVGPAVNHHGSTAIVRRFVQPHDLAPNADDVRLPPRRFMYWS